jgi:MoaA/NifB/PqqE/SkfB family radical SAM enzyme
VNLGLASIYQGMLRLRSGIPYRLLDGRYAFSPWHYYLEVTRRCNLRCRMCCNIKWLTENDVRTQAEGELTTTEWKDVIAQIGRLALITFTGGEPWIRPDFPELLETACSKHVVHCITNASLLKEKQIELCVRLAPGKLQTRGLFFMGISIDALGDLHDEIRGAKGVFDKAERAIRSIVDLRRRAGKRNPMIHVTSVIQRANVAVLPEMPAYIKRLGADVYNLTLESRSWDVAEIGSFDPALVPAANISKPEIEPQRLSDALEATCRAAESAGIELRLPRMPHEDIVNYYSGGYSLEKFQCRVPWNTLSIAYNGEVSPCFIRNVGNVRERRLKEIWSSGNMREFRKRARTGLWPVCEGCCEMEHHG